MYAGYDKPNDTLGGNPVTGGECWGCYSHSSYYAELPTQYLMDSTRTNYVDKRGNIVPRNQRIVNQERIKYEEKWGKPVNGNNPSAPILVIPKNSQQGSNYNEKPY